MEWTCAVDRIEGIAPHAIVVLIGDDDQVREVPAAELGEMGVEGAVLRVPLIDGLASWAAARRDLVEEASRRANLLNRLQKLRGRDPGGDLDL